MAESKVTNLSVSFANATELAAWVTNLAADITAGKITGFSISTDLVNNKIVGSLLIPAPAGLSTALEDA